MAKFNKQDKGESGPAQKSLSKALGEHVAMGKLRITLDSAGEDRHEKFSQKKRSTGRGAVTIGHGKAK